MSKTAPNVLSDLFFVPICGVPSTGVAFDVKKERNKSVYRRGIIAGYNRQIDNIVGNRSGPYGAENTQPSLNTELVPNVFESNKIRK